MTVGLALLGAEALAVYGLVFAVHAIRDRFTLVPYFGLLALLAATLRWSTDAGILYEIGPFTFILGSVVFFTAILFGIFLLYVFDGIQAAQIGIYTVVAISVLSPAAAMLLKFQLAEINPEAANRVIISTIRVYVSSTAAMILDFLFIAMFWEFFTRHGQRIPYLFRIMACLLAAYWLDAIIFCTGAFWGEADFGSIVRGNLVSRAALTLLVAPPLTLYVVWEKRRQHREFTPRALMALLHRSARRELDLFDAHLEIEERKRMEQELRESEERLDLALQGGDLGLWDWDIARNRVIFNERWATMLGYELSELEPTTDTWLRVLHPDDVPRALKLMTTHLKGESPYFEAELRMRTRDGTWRWVLSRGKVVTRLENGRAARVTGTHIDVTPLKESEAAIARAHAYQREIETRIEDTLLRARPPADLGGADVAALNVPSEHLDGDFADFVRLDPHRFDVLVGDVMGKGILAALVSAGAKNHFLRALAGQLAGSGPDGYPGPATLVGAVHANIARQLIELDCFLTLCYARFDLCAETMTYVDCGHTKTIRLRAAENHHEFLEGQNVPIGFLEAEVYAERVAAIVPGDIFVFYSDGVTESRDPGRAMFGVDRLLGTIRLHGLLEAEALAASIVDSAQRFSGTVGGGDDKTCVVVKIPDPACSPAPVERLTVPVSVGELGHARSFLQGFLGRHQALFSSHDAFNRVVLAFVEALSNIVRHAFDNPDGYTMAIELRAARNWLRIAVSHHGRAFQPRSTPLPDPAGNGEGGYGLYIMNRCFDYIAYETGKDGAQNLVLVKFFTSNDGPGDLQPRYPGLLENPRAAG